MKKYLLFAILSMALLTCCQNGSNPLAGQGGNNSGNDTSSTQKNGLKIIDAYDFTELPSNLYYVSFRFATSNVGYVTNPDSTVSISGSGAIIDLLLVAQAIDENHFPLAGTYNVGSDDAAFTASNTNHYFPNGKVIPAVYKVTDGETSQAISYNKGTVTVEGNSHFCTIKVSLACQDGFTRNYVFHGSITVIDKSYGNKPDPTGISFTENGPIELTVGGSKTLNIRFTPSNSSDNIQFSIDNTNVAQIANTGNTNCEIVGVAEGNCSLTATCVNSQISTSIQISVKSELDANYTFYDTYWMAATTDFPENEYVVYRYRRYRGNEIPDGGDAQLTRTVDYTRNIPNEGEWLYRKDTVFGGMTYELGIFRDTVKAIRTWILSSDLFFDADGTLQMSSSFAPLIEFQHVFVRDYKYSFCLGELKIVNDPTATDTIRPAGVAPQNMPGYIKASHFDSSIYLAYMSDAFNDDDVDRVDYPFFQTYDARILPVLPFTSDYDGSTYYQQRSFFGTVNGGYIWLESNYYNNWFGLAEYSINATLYANPSAYCLKTTFDNNGDIVLSQPLEMAASKNVTFTGGSNPQYAKKEFAPVRSRALEKRMKVTSTMGAVMKMYLFSTKKTWR